jgi:hypothetical protein
MGHLGIIVQFFAVFVEPHPVFVTIEVIVVVAKVAIATMLYQFVSLIFWRQMIGYRALHSEGHPEGSSLFVRHALPADAPAHRVQIAPGDDAPPVGRPLHAD